MAEFNPKAARIKRPLPFWVDAFQRDTQDLSTEEIGAYMLLLAAMWSRETCDLPDDDRRLARVCRVTESKWKRGLGAVMRGFLTVEDGAIFSKRLRKEAVYVEQFVKEQSDRKKGKEVRKPLKNKDQAPSVDDPRNNHGEPPEDPTQQPNNPTVKKERSKDLLSLCSDDVPSFDAFWDRFGNKTAKANAQKAWSKLRSDDRIAAFDASLGWLSKWQSRHPGASPLHPATFLNNRRWEDEQPQQSGFNGYAPRGPNAGSGQQPGGLVGAAIRSQARSGGDYEGWS